MSLHILPLPRLNKPSSFALVSLTVFSGHLIILGVHLWVLAVGKGHFSSCYVHSAGHRIPDGALSIWERDITSHTFCSTPHLQGIPFFITVDLLTHKFPFVDLLPTWLFHSLYLSP